MQRTLQLASNGRVVAELAEPRTNKFTLTYRPDATDDDAVSVRLPTGPDRYPPAAVGPFVAGLVPSLDRREELAADHEIPPHLAFRFLELLGNDLPGGLTCSPIDEPCPPGEIRVSGRPVEPTDLDDELSVVLVDGSWCLPGADVPSTHFLRVEDPILPGSAAAETFALRLAAQAGLPAARAELVRVHDTPAVAVARIDRIVTDEGMVRRRHCEHFGQILGIDTLPLDDAIYQELEGPGFRDLAEAMHRELRQPLDAIRTLAGLMVFHLVIGNTNAHAGTYSLLLPERVVAPIDTAIPAELYVELETDEGILELDHRLAMSINDFWKSDALDNSDLVAEAASWPGLSREAAIVAIDDVLDRLAAALRPTLDAVPGTPDRLAAMVTERIDHFRSPGSAARPD